MALSRGATRLDTAKSEARERVGEALVMVIYSALIAIFWWLYTYLNS